MGAVTSESDRMKETEVEKKRRATRRETKRKTLGDGEVEKTSETKGAKE